MGPVAVVALVLLLGPACTPKRSPLEVGLKRISLDLAFKSEKGAPKAIPTPEQLPLDVQSVAQFAVAAPAEEFPNVAPAQSPVYFAPPPDCPAAEPDAVPELPVSVTITKPPKAGRFDRNVKGTFDLEGGLIPFKGSLFPFDQIQYVNVTAPAGDGTFTFSTLQDLGFGNSITNDYKVLAKELDLVKRTTVLNKTTTTFTPTPAIKFIGLGVGEGDSWNSVGADPGSGTSMVVQGKIIKRELIDVCGSVYDTYQVQSTERIVNLTSQYSSATSDANDPSGGSGHPNIYNVATQFGGLFLRDEEHTITQIPPYTLTIDGTYTFRSVNPK